MSGVNYHVGALIQHERKKQNISQRKLARGIYTHQQLSDLEGNFLESDKLLMDILLQRLGKSPDKLEYIMSISEYIKIRTYALMYQCKYVEALENITKAIEITMPDWKNESLDEYLISTYEMENLLLYGELLISIDIKDACEHLELCLSYLENHFKDREELAKIYPKCIWLLTQIYTHDVYDTRMLKLCDNALELLRREYFAVFLEPLLNEKLKRCQRLGLKDEEEECNIYCSLFRELFSKYIPDISLNELFSNPCQCEYHLDYEILRGERLSKNKTQEYVSDGIFENKVSLSMIETHRKIASKKNIEKLFKALNINKQRCNILLATDSFDILDVKDELDYYQSVQDLEGIKNTLSKLEGLLDCNEKDNVRFINNLRKMYEFKTSNITAESALEVFKDILSETYSMDAEYRRVPLRNESLIINQMGLCMAGMGDYKGTVEMLNKTMQTFEKSKVSTRYNTRSYMLLYANYIRFLEESGDIDNITKAISLSHKCIRTELLLGKTSILAHYYTVLGCSIIDSALENKKEECKSYIKNAFFLNKFLYNDSDSVILETYYKEIFNESIM